MELNQLLLFLTVASCLAVIFRAVRSPTAVPWLAAVGVLVASGGAWIFARGYAGYVSFGAWFLLLLIPAIIRNPRSFRRFRPHGITPVVLTLVLLNVAMFTLELVKTGPDLRALLLGYDAPRFNLALHTLGEVDPIYVVAFHQYWRLIAALFLHYGALHLILNLLGLYVLGPAFEIEVGAIRFLVIYMLAGLASTGGVVLLMRYGAIAPAELVGASGSIMGIIGAWGGYLLRNRHAPLARQRLMNIFFIVATQVIFDMLTPRVSMSAHLCGLATGFILGLILAHPARSTPRFAGKLA